VGVGVGAGAGAGGSVANIVAPLPSMYSEVRTPRAGRFACFSLSNGIFARALVLGVCVGARTGLWLT
jgi:hypothetical protein